MAGKAAYDTKDFRFCVRKICREKICTGEKDMAGKGKAAYERYGGKRFVLAAGEKDMAGKAGKRSLRFGGKTPRHPPLQQLHVANQVRVH